MTPRERVLCALSHQTPDRIPFSWGFGPTAEMAEHLRADLARRGIVWAKLHDATNDILRYAPKYVGSDLPPDTDMWGIRRQRISYGGGTYDEIAHSPLAELDTVAKIAAYPWPNPDLFDDAGLRRQIVAANPDRRRAVQIWYGTPFETCSWMTGLENTMMRLLTDRELVVASLEHITGFYEARLRRMLAVCGDLVDIVFMGDDLGGQNGLLFSREIYRKVLQPFHRRMIETSRRGAPQARTMFHSDGAVIEVIPDLMEAGIDILEAVQTDAKGMDPSHLKAAFGAKLSFHGAISVQNLLPHRDADTVRQECVRLVKILGQGGGYIAAPSHAIQVGTPPENVLAMLQAVLGEADYRAAVDAAAV